MNLRDYYKRYAIPVWTLAIFTAVGVVMWIVRDWRYFSLFAGIGVTEFVSRSIVIRFPQRRQLVRRVIQVLIGSILFVMLGLVFGVNFQFEQVFFDMQAGIVTGALIQLIIARLVIPWVFGNAFCSRACWDGAMFEVVNNKDRCKRPWRRREWLAWLYLLCLVGMTVLVCWLWRNPADANYDNANILLRKNWIVGSNLFILMVGWVGSLLWGSRFYCRQLCPFMTISSLLYRWSWLKVHPIHSERCTQCGKCNKVCPMLSDVKGDVKAGRAVSNRQCILCERCVSACPQGVLGVSHDKKVKKND